MWRRWISTILEAPLRGEAVWKISKGGKKH